jgi:predicted AAA+ superfamily ATPase
LRFLRDSNRREVDFVVMKNKRPIFAIECKSGEKAASPHLSYFAERTDIPIFYQVHRGTRAYSVSDRIHVLPFAKFCSKESMV